MLPPSPQPPTPGAPHRSVATGAPMSCRSPNGSVCGTARFAAEPCASFWSATTSRAPAIVTTAVMGFRWSPPISNPPAEDLVARYASRWGIEQAFADARQIMGVGDARSRTRRAVERTVPFGLICFSLVTIWYALHGHAPQDVTGHRTRARWRSEEHTSE